MSLSIEQWHQRYLEQSHWTRDLRMYLYQKCNIKEAKRILDVGCGTGVLEKELSTSSSGSTFGIDLNCEALEFASRYAPGSIFTASDGLDIPYPAGVFDICLCHFLLLWVNRVQEFVDEMVRVTKPGGYVMAMAEPDYGGRIDYPDIFAQIGNWQNRSLIEQGANPYIGRRLRSIFTLAGLRDIEGGVLGAHWGRDSANQDDELEWQVLLADLETHPELIRQVESIREAENHDRILLKKILFVPVFYAFGRIVE
jgi:SAM-dependent methyltransferase